MHSLVKALESGCVPLSQQLEARQDKVPLDLKKKLCVQQRAHRLTRASHKQHAHMQVAVTLACSCTHVACSLHCYRAGTKFRVMLRSGEDIPDWFAFKSVINVLREQVKAEESK